MAQALRTRGIQGDPLFLDARTDRLANEFLDEGALGADDFEVVPQASPNMTVRVGSGVAGDRYVVPVGREQGTYVVRNPDAYIGSGNSDVQIANGDATHDRIDLVVLQVYDDEFDDSGEAKTEVEVVQGTPAASPAVPATPDGAVVLAEVEVAAGLSSGITAGMIADRRVLTGVWTDYTATLGGITLGDGDLDDVRYIRSGGKITCKGKLTWGTTTASAGSGIITISLPVPAAAGLADVGSAVIYDANLGEPHACACFLNSETNIRFGYEGGPITATGPTYWADVADELRWTITYEPA